MRCSLHLLIFLLECPPTAFSHRGMWAIDHVGATVEISDHLSRWSEISMVPPSSHGFEDLCPAATLLQRQVHLALPSRLALNPGHLNCTVQVLEVASDRNVCYLQRLYKLRQPGGCLQHRCMQGVWNCQGQLQAQSTQMTQGVSYVVRVAVQVKKQFLKLAVVIPGLFGTFGNGQNAS